MKRLICAAIGMALVVSAGTASAAEVAEHQWVRASSNGTVKGRVVVPRSEGISAVRSANVTLIDRDGAIAGKPVKSDQTGRFTLRDVRPGVYTLTIHGKDAFACCAMHVVDADVPINNEFEIAAGAVQYSVVRNAMARYMPSSQPTAVIFDPRTNPFSTADSAISSESVRIAQHEGGLRGRLIRAGFSPDLGAKKSNVLVYRDGVEVARTITDETGNFSIAELGPGSYSVLGSGKDGFGLLGLELIDPLAIQTVRVDEENDTTLVAQPNPVPDTFQMQVAPLPGAGVVVDDFGNETGEVVPLDGTGVAFDGAPMGGGGGGAGGGGAIGGGGGSLLMWGGIGAAIAIAASNDDDAIALPPIASPVVPVTP